MTVLQTWEYLEVRYTHVNEPRSTWVLSNGTTRIASLAEVLNELGAEGWELVGGNGSWVLKRPTHAT